MIGVVTSYRRGRHTQYNNQVIVKFEGIESREAATNLLGKKIIWISPGGKVMVGKIIRVHGNKGRVRARFRKGVPGQMIGDIVYLIEDPNKIKDIIKKVKEAKDINQAHKFVREILK